MVRSRKKRQFEKEIDHRYIVDKLLGEGGFCVVFKAADKATGKKVAIKRMDKTKPLYRKFQNPKAMDKLNQLMYREADVMRSLNHENLMKLLDFIDTGVHIYLVLEFAEGGELYARLLKAKRFKESFVVTIIKQVIHGVKYMHENGYIHRDIKAENILFRDKKSSIIMITDFGLSKPVDGMLFTNCGTLVYSAPELIQNKETKHGYDKMVDNWAIGVLTYLLLCGHLPFDDYQQNETKIVRKIMSGRVSFPYSEWNSVNVHGKKFVLKLLESDPLKRLSLSDALQHQFLYDAKENKASKVIATSVDEKKVESKKLILFPMMEASRLQVLARVRWNVTVCFSLTFAIFSQKIADGFIDN